MPVQVLRKMGSRAYKASATIAVLAPTPPIHGTVLENQTAPGWGLSARYGPSITSAALYGPAPANSQWQADDQRDRQGEATRPDCSLSVQAPRRGFAAENRTSHTTPQVTSQVKRRGESARFRLCRVQKFLGRILPNQRPAARSAMRALRKRFPARRA